MHWFTVDGRGGSRGAGTRPGEDAMNGNAVMYDTGKILTCGGATDYERKDAHTTAAVITLSTSGENEASVKATSPMQYARAFSMAVPLPDGKVAVFGGQPYPIPFSDDDAALVSGALGCLLGAPSCAAAGRAKRRPVCVDGYKSLRVHLVLVCLLAAPRRVGDACSGFALLAVTLVPQ